MMTMNRPALPTALRLDVGTLCRLDPVLMEHIERSQQLWHIGGRAAALVVVGGFSYGFAFGVWRSAEQGLYSAIKLPLLLFAIVVSCALINGILAQLLRAPLGIAQGLVAILLSLSVAAALLAALSPVSLFLVLSVPGPDLGGHLPGDPQLLHRTAEYVLFYHIVVIGVAGVVGNLRLYQLLCRLTRSKPIAQRVLVSWIAVDALVGTQLSWILRPYLCKPALPAALWRPDALQGNFFEEVWRILAPLLS